MKGGLLKLLLDEWELACHRKAFQATIPDY